MSAPTPNSQLPSPSTQSNDEVLVRVEGVKKKFCRSLKKSLWYGVKDMASEVIGGKGHHEALRAGEFWAVNDVSFQLKRGECIGLIGHNGAGKTTLLKMLNGLIKPDLGRITMRGRIGALIALGAGFNPILTGRENIYVNGAVLGLTRREIDEKIEEIIDFSEIRDFIDAPVQSYSSGMAVRLGFAIAAKCQPDVLLLDEVLAVGDIGFQAKCFNTLASYRKQGTAFILVSHNMHLISRYCDQVLYLKRGSIVHLGGCESGIEHFLKDMHGTNSDVAGGVTDWSKAYGSGELQLIGATFYSDEGQVVESIATGDPVTLELQFECSGEHIRDVVFDVKMTDKESTLFQTTSDDCGVVFDGFPTLGKISIRFKSLVANSPQVLFFITVFNRNSKEVYDWKRNIKLLIENKPKLVGRIDLPTEWAIKKLENVLQE